MPAASLLIVSLVHAQSVDPTGGWAPSPSPGGAPAPTTGEASAPPGEAGPPPGETPTPPDGEKAVAAGAETRQGVEGERGIVVRLEAPTLTAKAVAALLTPEGRAAIRIPLKDDGRPPDVSAGDGLWSGSVWTAGDRFQVEVTGDERRWSGQTVEWSSSDTKRDLALVLDGDTLTATAATPPERPAPLDAAPDPAGGALAGTQAPGEAPPGSPTNTPGLGAPFPKTSNTSTSWMLFFAVGAALVAIGYSFWRGGGGRARIPGAVTRMPEPGVLGGGTPSLSDGVSVWVVPDLDLPAALGGLLATLSGSHRVLVAAPPAMVVPLVRGGPVYRVAFLKAARLGDTADAMVEQPGLPLAVVILGQGLDGAVVQAVPEHLPEGVGAIVLVPTRLETSLPTVEFARTGEVWTLRTSSATVGVVETPAGFTRGEPPRP